MMLLRPAKKEFNVPNLRSNYIRAYCSIVNYALTRRYDVENTWPLLVSNLIGGPTAESAIIDFVFRRVAGYTLGTVREKLLRGKCGKVS